MNEPVELTEEQAERYQRQLRAIGLSFIGLLKRESGSVEYWLNLATDWPFGYCATHNNHFNHVCPWYG